MNKEIELKAWVDEPEKIKKKLSDLYGEPSAIKKDDIYYKYRITGSDRGQPVRLRVEDGRNVVTIKQKHINNGVEMNDELEFIVDDGGKFLQFMRMSGAEKWVSKKKIGWKFSSLTDAGTVLIELCKVSDLGWFIEIEIVIDSPDEQQVEDARKMLLSILKSVGIKEDKIESRFYSDMLLDAK